jgi:hypothetical protein
MSRAKGGAANGDDCVDFTVEVSTSFEQRLHFLGL